MEEIDPHKQHLVVFLAIIPYTHFDNIVLALVYVPLSTKFGTVSEALDPSNLCVSVYFFCANSRTATNVSHVIKYFN